MRRVTVTRRLRRVATGTTSCCFILNSAAISSTPCDVALHAVTNIKHMHHAAIKPVCRSYCPIKVQNDQQRARRGGGVFELPPNCPQPRAFPRQLLRVQNHENRLLYSQQPTPPPKRSLLSHSHTAVRASCIHMMAQQHAHRGGSHTVTQTGRRKALRKCNIERMGGRPCESFCVFTAGILLDWETNFAVVRKNG